MGARQIYAIIILFIFFPVLGSAEDKFHRFEDRQVEIELENAWKDFELSGTKKHVRFVLGSSSKEDAALANVANGKVLEIELRPSRLLSDNYQAEVTDRLNRRRKIKQRPEIQSFEGTVIERSGSGSSRSGPVRITRWKSSRGSETAGAFILKDSTGSSEIGLLEGDGGLESSLLRSTRTSLEQLSKQSTFFCQTVEDHSALENGKAAAVPLFGNLGNQSLPVKVVEIATDAHCSMLDGEGAFFNSVQDVNLYLLAVVNAASLVLEDQLSVRLEVSFQHLWESCDTSPFAARPLPISQFRNYWNSNFSNQQYDWANLFISEQIKFGEGTIAGIAALGGICGSYSYSVSTLSWHPFVAGVPEFVTTWSVFLHELGHGLGARHDNSCDPYYVMCPAHLGETRTFSSQSFNEIMGVLNNVSCYDSSSEENQPPYFTGEVEKRYEIDEGETLKINFPTAADPDGDLQEVRMVNLPKGASFENNTLSFPTSFDTIDAVLDDDWGCISYRMYTPRLVARDQFGNASVLQTEILLNNASSQPAYFTQVPEDTEMAVGQSLNTKIQAVDPDEPFISYGQSSYYEIDGLDINKRTGDISWTPTAEQAGTHRIVVLAVECASGPTWSKAEFTVKVYPNESAPLITPVSTQYVREREQLKLPLSVSTLSGDASEVFLIDPPLGAKIEGGELIYDVPADVIPVCPDTTLNHDRSELITIKMQAKNVRTKKLSPVETVKILVSENNASPEFSFDVPLYLPLGTTHNIPVGVTDPEGDPLKVVFEPEEGYQNIVSFNSESMMLTITIPEEFEGYYHYAGWLKAYDCGGYRGRSVKFIVEGQDPTSTPTPTLDPTGSATPFPSATPSGATPFPSQGPIEPEDYVPAKPRLKFKRRKVVISAPAQTLGVYTFEYVLFKKTRKGKRRKLIKTVQALSGIIKLKLSRNTFKIKARAYVDYTDEISVRRSNPSRWSRKRIYR